MVSYSGKRSARSARAMAEIKQIEWGLLILDEVHQVPANTFRRVITACPSHTKLGLTATLVREDDRISDLNFLIGPKLYEANWLDLAAAGHLSTVSCSEIWTPMTAEFMAEYIKATREENRLWRRSESFSRLRKVLASQTRSHTVNSSSFLCEWCAQGCCTR